MSEAKKGISGENHPMYGKNHTDESKTKMSEANQGQPRPEGAGRPFQQIEVIDSKNNTTILYDSIREAARALNLPNHFIISNYIKNNQKKPYKGIYSFRLLKK
jgi:group I intron endonuclease